MQNLHTSTPVVVHHGLSQALNKRVWLKLENTQPSGSFKMRGIGLLCQRAHAKGARHFVCPSGGNAGYAAALAGQALGVATTILVMQATPESVKQRIAALGAEVRVAGASWDEIRAAALDLSAQPGHVYIPPFDHPDIWEGNASLIAEAVTQAEFDAVICSVGGGGLLAGIVQGLHAQNLTQLPVLAVETEGAASLRAALEAQQLVSLPGISTVATSLAANQVAQGTLDWCLRHPVSSHVVSDREAVDACLRFANDSRMLVEPACGAALAIAYSYAEKLAAYQNPLIVVCGGLGVDLEKLTSWKTQFEL